MGVEEASEMLTVNLSERDKDKLRIVAALRGVRMRAVVRELIAALPAPQIRNGGGYADGN